MFYNLIDVGVWWITDVAARCWGYFAQCGGADVSLTGPVVAGGEFVVMRCCALLCVVRPNYAGIKHRDQHSGHLTQLCNMRWERCVE